MARTIPFLPGDGTEIHVEVAYIADFPCAPNGTCAFCLGDPCAENQPPHPRIAAYYARNADAQTCPMCDGRPT